MISKRIAEYKGDKTACDQCERPFENGEAILVGQQGGKVFCGTMGGCVIAHASQTGETIFTDTMRFRVSS